MSEKRQINMGLLEGLDENTFLGKVLTTTNEEIAEVFNTEITTPSEKEVAAGPIGTLTPLEKALFAQAHYAKKQADKLADEYNEAAKKPEFDELPIDEQREKYEAASEAVENEQRNAQHYLKLAWSMVRKRLGDAAGEEIGIRKDGNIYNCQEEENAEFPICPGCGKRHAPNPLSELIGKFFGGGRSKKEKAEA